MHHSDWDIVSVERDRVFVIDLNLGNLSVTNDAEAVWDRLQRLYPGRRLIYRDSLGDWDEIVMGKRARCSFIPYREYLPKGY